MYTEVSGHCGNPVASLHVVQLYGVPFLLPALVLSKTDENAIGQHHNDIIQNIQKLQGVL